MKQIEAKDRVSARKDFEEAEQRYGTEFMYMPYNEELVQKAKQETSKKNDNEEEVK